MSLPTLRAIELLVKNSDKVSKDKPMPAPSALPFTSDGKAFERINFRGETRSVSPSCSRAAQRARLDLPEDVCLGLPTALESAGDASDSGEPGPSRRYGITPFRHINLEVCPSFSEQRNKMAFLERHETLQRVHSAELKRRNGLCEAASLQPVSECNDEVESGSSGNDIAAGPSDTENLLGWDLTRSKLWLVVGLVLKAIGPSALPANADADPAGLNPSALERVAEENEDSLDSAVEPPDAVTACETVSRPRGALERWRSVMRRARNISPSMLSTPLGMGFTRKPSMSSFQTSRGFSGRFERWSSIGAASSPAPLPCSGLDRHHVAYAAGLAAATSAAAAVSHAATVAAAGVSIVAGPTSASTVLELGTKALSSCGGLLVEKVQNVAARHATAAVAEAILGPHTCEVTRTHLVNWVQATVAGASIMFFIGNLAAMSDTLMHLDFEHDFTESAKVMLDLVTSGPGFVENCKDLMCVAVAVGVEVAHRNNAGFKN
ncbi:hypothetical protein Vretimale_1806 [Volvox reticuliferus]|uniref:Uncharacterized protein n=1 Tax=Volvox reticuliferus TaxID=1737510 RepID=A0A8J4DA33_9CHLO|nr:hypothetical protein Vretifemale_17447 [Volvox reticuliferus]GIL95869.1 hypothetical protein Vretimale_1806 [Volvox reticuliferus]